MTWWCSFFSICIKRREALTSRSPAWTKYFNSNAVTSHQQHTCKTVSKVESKTTIWNPNVVAGRASCCCCCLSTSFKWQKRLAAKCNYRCKWREKRAKHTEKRMTQYVDNLYVIDCSCSAVIVIHSVTLCHGRMWRLQCHSNNDASSELGWTSLFQLQLRDKHKAPWQTVNCECVIEANGISDCPICWWMPQPEGTLRD